MPIVLTTVGVGDGLQRADAAVDPVRARGHRADRPDLDERVRGRGVQRRGEGDRAQATDHRRAPHRDLPHVRDRPGAEGRLRRDVRRPTRSAADPRPPIAPASSGWRTPARCRRRRSRSPPSCSATGQGRSPARPRDHLLVLPRDPEAHRRSRCRGCREGRRAGSRKRGRESTGITEKERHGQRRPQPTWHHRRGRIGQAMARTAKRAGRPVVMANSRGPDSLTSVVSALGDGMYGRDRGAGSSREHRRPGCSLVERSGGGPDLDWRGQIVIDVTNDFDPSDLDGRTSSEVVADLVAPALVVKTANTLVAALLASHPHEAGGRRVLFLSGDDSDASQRWARCPRPPASPRSTSVASAPAEAMQQVGAPLAGVNLIQL